MLVLHCCSHSSQAIIGTHDEAGLQAELGKCSLRTTACVQLTPGMPISQAVKVRGESMAAAAKLGRPHGMLSIIGLDDAILAEVCDKARAKLGDDTVCQLANYLFPTGRVVSGHKDALDEVQALATAAGAMKCAPLAVSGAFHTRLMEPARDKLIQVGRPLPIVAPS